MKRLICLPASICIICINCFSQAVNFTSSNLPVIIINTNGQTIIDEPKITADMGIVFNANNARNNVSDPFNQYNGKIGIELRGQSSQMFPMKSYGLELRDNSGNSQNKSIFGLPKESDWILYAPYTDKTLMRNFLAYTMSQQMGHWAAHCRFVELVLNGEYQGIYVFMEKIKWGSGRVNVTKMAVTDTSGDALTGGYIFSLDKGANAWFSSYQYPGIPAYPQFSYVYPKPESIVPQQEAYIKNYVDSFETALYGPQFQDPVNGVRKFADVPSFIDYFIVNEVSRNVDAYRLSSYFYKDRNSINRKIFAGPVWDYDLAFRNDDYCNSNDTTGWAYNFNKICTADAWYVPFWWNNFMKDTAFVGDLRCRWKSLRTTSLSDGYFYGLIDSVASLLGEASQRHFQQWPVLGVYVWPNPQPIPTSYAGEITELKLWLSARLKWIDENLPNTGACSDYPAGRKESIIVSINPNPVNASTTMTIQSSIHQNASVRILDALGRTWQMQTVSLQTGTNTIQLNPTSWATGVYFIWIQSSTGDKLVKKVLRD